MHRARNGSGQRMAVDAWAAARVLDGASRALARLHLVRGASQRTQQRMACAAATMVAAASLLGASPVRAATPLFVPSNPAVAFGNVGNRNSPVLADLDGDGDLDAFFGEFYGRPPVLFENTGDSSSPAFAASSPNPYGLRGIGYGSSPAFADLDGDGDLDAILGERYGNTVFFENTGNSSSPAFAAPAANPFGLARVTSFSRPAFADIDGDGDLDAFIGSGARYAFAVFFENTGNASSPAFAASSADPFGLTSGWEANSPTFADVDGDGDLDAFQSTFFFRNTGDSSSPNFAFEQADRLGLPDFRAVARYSTPTFADIDGDGDLDAFIGEHGRPRTILFENTGNASAPAFAAFPANPFGVADVAGSSSPAFADVDADGDLDAFIGERNGHTVFFENVADSSSPAFAGSSVNPFGLADVGDDSRPVFTDLDGDGDLDAFIGERNGHTVFFENTADSSSPAFVTAFSLAVLYDSSPVFADLDGDGDLDAFIGERSGNTVFFENTGDSSSPVFAASSANPFGLARVGGFSSPAFADIDSDGDLDAVIGTSDGDLVFFENTGDFSSPAFAASVLSPFGLIDVGSDSSPTFADLDGDGDLDAFIGETSGDTVFFENTGDSSSPAFTTPSANPFGLHDVRFRGHPTFADIDADGDLDVFVGSAFASTGNTFFFENTGDSSSPAFAVAARNPFGLVAVESSSHPAFADIDGDGDLDAFIGERDGTTDVFENTGNASSPAFLAHPFGLADVGLDSDPDFADIDGDGDLDAFIGTVFFENSGDSSYPVFATSSPTPFGLAGFFDSSPAFADIDGDGDLDAFIGQTDGNTVFLENSGDSSSPAFAASLADPFGLANVGSFSHPTFADIDGDGDLDAFFGNGDGQTVFFENRGLATATTPTATPTQTPTPSPTAFVTPSRTAVPRCAGDCDGNERVEIDELILGVAVSLGTAEASACLAMDADGDGQVSIDEVVRAVGNALRGC